MVPRIHFRTIVVGFLIVIHFQQKPRMQLFQPTMEGMHASNIVSMRRKQQVLDMCAAVLSASTVARTGSKAATELHSSSAQDE